MIPAGLAHMLGHPFMRNAIIAGSAVGLASGLVGYFLVLRSQVFTGDALSHVAFTGSLAALAFGVNPRVGLFTATVVVAVLLGALGPRGRADDVVIGSVFAWVLGLGVLFLSIFTSERSTANGKAGVNVLFGSIFGLDRRAAVMEAAIAIFVCACILAIARPLLFASLDEAVADARGVPVRIIGYAFLAIVGLATAEATQAVGALLLLGLLAAPAGIARHLTARPFTALWISGSIGLAAVCCGLVLSYTVPVLPPSFAILTTLAAAYLAASLAGRRGWSGTPARDSRSLHGAAPT